MSDYVHWACLGALCAFLPLPGNRIMLPMRRTGTACRWRGFATPGATTTSSC